MGTKATHALVVMLYDWDIGLGEDQAVLLFDSEEQAYDWAADRLVRYGLVQRNEEDDYWIDGDDPEGTLLADPYEAVNEWAEGLGSSEYFHVVPIVCPD